MKPGPPPKPTAVKVAEGNPGKRPLNKGEPQPRSGKVRCPSWLDKEAKACWRRTVVELEGMALLTSADTDALTAYCESWSRWRIACNFLREHGHSYALRDDPTPEQVKDGKPGKIRCFQQFPEVAIARNLLSAILRYQLEFGLTPSARSRINIVDLNPPDDTYDALDAAMTAEMDEPASTNPVE